MNPRRVRNSGLSRHAGLYLARSGGFLASERGTVWVRDLAALAERIAQGGPVTWLSPTSRGDWRALVPLLDKASVGIRQGRVATLYSGSFRGRSAGGWIDFSEHLPPKEEAQRTFEAMGTIDQAIDARWPMLRLEATPARTGVEILRSYLTRPIECPPQLEVTLRRAGAYGGGRIQMYVAPGHSAPAWDLDLRAAYPTALELVPIGVEPAGEASESAYRDPCVLAACAVEVPEMRHGPLRHVTETGLEYPTGTTLVGCWSGSELRAAEACGAVVRAVHTVWRFHPCPVFQRWGIDLAGWRESLPTSHPARRVAKSMAVQTVGSWGMRPATTRAVVGTEGQRMGARLVAPGIYLVREPPKQHPRSLLPAACLVTGAVRAWTALVLKGAEATGNRCIYWHTDGGAFEHDPTPALRWAVANGAPPLERWKVRRLQSLETWAPGQRIEVDHNGARRVVAGGIAGTLDEEKALRAMRRESQ